MLHFTCDLCGHPLPGQRYIVKVEVYPAPNLDGSPFDMIDNDHLQELGDVLGDLESFAITPTGDDGSSKRLRFDLCADCREKYLADPLGTSFQRRYRTGGH